MKHQKKSTKIQLPEGFPEPFRREIICVDRGRTKNGLVKIEIRTWEPQKIMVFRFTPDICVSEIGSPVMRALGDGPDSKERKAQIEAVTKKYEAKMWRDIRFKAETILKHMKEP